MPPTSPTPPIRSYTDEEMAMATVYNTDINGGYIAGKARSHYNDDNGAMAE